MDLISALLDSWDRQVAIVDALAEKVNAENRHFKPSDDGMPLDEQLKHTHWVRRFWLERIAPDLEAPLSEPTDDLDDIRAKLKQSAKAVRDATERGLKEGKYADGSYDHPVLFLQHMVWHEGWHVGLIMLALRINGQEPPEEWEDPNLWGRWRNE